MPKIRPVGRESFSVDQLQTQRLLRAYRSANELDVGAATKCRATERSPDKYCLFVADRHFKRALSGIGTVWNNDAVDTGHRINIKLRAGSGLSDPFTIEENIRPHGKAEQAAWPIKDDPARTLCGSRRRGGGRRASRTLDANGRAV